MKKGRKKLEEVLNELVLMDDECKKVLQALQEKKDNMEYLVSVELNKRKEEIKTKYKFKVDMRKNEYDLKLSENMKRIEKEKIHAIEQMKKSYAEQKQTMVNTIIQAIL